MMTLPRPSLIADFPCEVCAATVPGTHKSSTKCPKCKQTYTLPNTPDKSVRA
jgi:hypothetical protein